LLAKKRAKVLLFFETSKYFDDFFYFLCHCTYFGTTFVEGISEKS